METEQNFKINVLRTELILTITDYILNIKDNILLMQYISTSLFCSSQIN